MKTASKRTVLPQRVHFSGLLTLHDGAIFEENHTIGPKLRLIAEFMENRVTHEKLYSFNKINNYLMLYPEKCCIYKGLCHDILRYFDY